MRAALLAPRAPARSTLPVLPLRALTFAAQRHAMSQRGTASTAAAAAAGDGDRDVAEKRDESWRALAKRLHSFMAPTVWHEFTPLAVECKAINLGQGFPGTCTCLPGPVVCRSLMGRGPVPRFSLCATSRRLAVPFFCKERAACLHRRGFQPVHPQCRPSVSCNCSGAEVRPVAGKERGRPHRDLCAQWGFGVFVFHNARCRTKTHTQHTNAHTHTCSSLIQFFEALCSSSFPFHVHLSVFRSVFEPDCAFRVAESRG